MYLFKVFWGQSSVYPELIPDRKKHVLRAPSSHSTSSPPQQMASITFTATPHQPTPPITSTVTTSHEPKSAPTHNQPVSMPPSDRVTPPQGTTPSEQMPLISHVPAPSHGFSPPVHCTPIPPPTGTPPCGSIPLRLQMTLQEQTPVHQISELPSPAILASALSCHPAPVDPPVSHSVLMLDSAASTTNNGSARHGRKKCSGILLDGSSGGLSDVNICLMKHPRAQDAEDSSSTSALSSTINVPDEVLKWFEDALMMLQSENFGPLWHGLLKTWSDFEIQAWFTEQGKLGATHRPTYISDWIQCRHSVTWCPDINVLQFERNFDKWWTSLQPSWCLSSMGIIELQL